MDGSGTIGDSNRDFKALNDERITKSSYSASYNWGVQNWNLDKLVERIIEDVDGKVYSKKQIFYDDETFSENNLGQGSKGNLTMTLDWRNPSDDADYVHSVRNRFDPYGNVICLYDPLADLKADGSIRDAGKGHFREIAYDSVFHTYPIQETIYTGNFDGQKLGIAQPSISMNATYDYGLGAITSSVDYNGNKTNYNYDNYGRLQSIIKPGDTPQNPTTKYAYELAHQLDNGKVINWVETNQREVSGQAGTLDSRTFYDGLGRTIMTRSEGEEPGQVVVSDTIQFNARKIPWKKFLPYFENISGTDLLQYQPPTFQTGYTEHHYDALGRENVIYQPLTQGETQRVFARKTYEPLSKKIEDEEQTNPSSPHYGCAMRYVEDGLQNKDGEGRLQRVEEIVKIDDNGKPLNEPVVWITSYSYDPLDNFTGYIDSQGNQKFFQYDALNRKIFMNDPDRGVMYYTYDAASNLLQTVDAKNQKITYTYDGVNRLLTEDYQDTANRNPDVAYIYDVPADAIPLGDGTIGTAQQTKGFLSYIKDLSGEEHNSYDERGRVKWVVKRIPDPRNGVLTSYKTEMDYDALDRVIALTYPDNDKISYHFNSRNLLKCVTGGDKARFGVNPFIIGDIQYMPSGQLQQCRYGDGVISQYNYDPRLRMNSLIAAPEQNSSQNSSKPLISYTYTFDGASNITRIDDRRPESVHPAGDKLRNTQIFTYDDLYRITGVQYSFALPKAPDRNDGQISYRYDRIGNMLEQTSDIAHIEKGLSVTNHGAMSYGGTLGRNGRLRRKTGDAPGPHALTATASGRNYPYDDNGNMTNIDGLACSWDFKDRLVAVEDAKIRAEYTYDYTDRRIAKKVWDKSQIANGNLSASTTTLYIDEFFEVREHDQPMKYVWNGETRVAEIIGSLDMSRERVQRLRVWKGWNLLSIAVNTSNAAAQLGIGNDSSLVAAFLWNSNTQTWLSLSGQEVLPVGSVIWVYSTESKILQIRGKYDDPVSRSILSGGEYISSTGLEALSLEKALQPPMAQVWRYEAEQNNWKRWFNGAFSFLSNSDGYLPPGEAVYLQNSTNIDLTPNSANYRIHYYHQDHLGSTNILTDAEGERVEESVNYPFGYRRETWGRIDSSIRGFYSYSQKEHDLENNLFYLGSRYYNGVLNRFVSVDKLSQTLKKSWLARPQLLNANSYCGNSPLAYKDSKGFDRACIVGQMNYYSNLNPSISYQSNPKMTTSEEVKKFIESMKEPTMMVCNQFLALVLVKCGINLPSLKLDKIRDYFKQKGEYQEVNNNITSKTSYQLLKNIQEGDILFLKSSDLNFGSGTGAHGLFVKSSLEQMKDSNGNIVKDKNGNAYMGFWAVDAVKELNTKIAGGQSPEGVGAHFYRVNDDLKKRVEGVVKSNY